MKKLILSTLLVSFLVFVSQAQNNSGMIQGKVIDSQNVGVADVAVFVPFTSIWSTTNSKGEFSLKGFPAGKVEISFRHLSFEPQTLLVQISSGSVVNLNVVLVNSVVEMNEVVKKASSADWKRGFEIFSQYILGDKLGRSCKVKNPEDMFFYFDGNRLVGHATKPLEIENNYLGYTLIYYLDYFWWEERNLLLDDSHPQISFAFSGSALYKDRIDDNWVRKIGWERNRQHEFKGTLRHFMQSIYDGKVVDQGYILKEAWVDFEELQKSKNMSPAVAYAQFHEMNKVFYWNPTTKRASYISYSPYHDYQIICSEVDTAQKAETRSFEIKKPLLVFSFWSTASLNDESRVVFFSADASGSREITTIEIDYFGNYTCEGEELIWTYLDNNTNLINALPEDYMGRDKKH